MVPLRRWSIPLDDSPSFKLYFRDVLVIYGVRGARGVCGAADGTTYTFGKRPRWRNLRRALPEEETTVVNLDLQSPRLVPFLRAPLSNHRTTQIHASSVRSSARGASSADSCTELNIEWMDKINEGMIDKGRIDVNKWKQEIKYKIWTL